VTRVPEFEWEPAIRKPQVHHSSLDVLWKCGVMFEFRYIRKIRMSPTSAIHVGRAVDQAANLNLQNKIDTDELLPEEHVLDIARDATVGLFETEGVTPSPDEPEDPKIACELAVDKAVRLSRAHHTKLAPKLKPRAVQRPWAMEIPGFPFDITGTRDLDETDGTIRDLKTSKRSPPKTAADTTDQGTLYSMSAWVVDQTPPPVRFALDTIVDLKTETKVVTQESTRDLDDFQVMANRIENAERIIRTGAFTPARQTDWWCSLTYCAYARMCPYFRQPKQFSTGESQ